MADRQITTNHLANLKDPEARTRFIVEEIRSGRGAQIDAALREELNATSKELKTIEVRWKELAPQVTLMTKTLKTIRASLQEDEKIPPRSLEFLLNSISNVVATLERTSDKVIDEQVGTAIADRVAEIKAMPKDEALGRGKQSVGGAVTALAMLKPVHQYSSGQSIPMLCQGLGEAVSALVGLQRAFDAKPQEIQATDKLMKSIENLAAR